MKRSTFWIAFLTGAAALALAPELWKAPAEIPAPVARPAPAQAAGQATAAVPALEVRADRWPAGMERNAFPRQTWVIEPPPRPAAPPPPPPPPPAAPSAPPLPFRFLGRLDDRASLKVFLQRGDRVLAVGVGDVIDQTYRIDSVTDSYVLFVYLPLNVRQTLSVGSPP